MKRIILTILTALAICHSAFPADFFSTAQSEELFTFGVRAGLNTSNRTVKKESAGIYNFQSWGTGFTAGVIADLNFRDYLSIEPGVFFESRSGHSMFTSESVTSTGDTYYVTQAAHRHTYNLTIPVLASVRFNISNDLRWHLDFGPYLAFVLKSRLKNQELISTRPDIDNEPPFTAKTAPVDFGFKMGSAFEFRRHLYVGIHYEAGAIKAYQNMDLGGGLEKTFGGRTKAWNFTVGLNF